MVRDVVVAEVDQEATVRVDTVVVMLVRVVRRVVLRASLLPPSAADSVVVVVPLLLRGPKHMARSLRVRTSRDPSNGSVAAGIQAPYHHSGRRDAQMKIHSSATSSSCLDLSVRHQHLICVLPFHLVFLILYVSSARFAVDQTSRQTV